MSNQKFKIWLPASKKMTHAHSILELANWNPSGLAFEKSDIFLQYTGRNDKFGNEIYDGDYCEAMFRTRNGFKHIRGQIIFDEFMWCLDSKETCEVFSLNRPHDFIVLGNIYENPELLA